MRLVSVIGFPSHNDQKHIMVTIASDPIEVYVSKDQIHAGWVKEGKFVPDPEKRASISERDITKVLRLYFHLLNTIDLLKRIVVE